MLPLVLFSDDTSGNKTKKLLWNLMLAGPPHHINLRHESIHFLSCSDLVSSFKQSKPIAQQHTLLETEEVVVRRRCAGSCSSAMYCL